MTSESKYLGKSAIDRISQEMFGVSSDKWRKIQEKEIQENESHFAKYGYPKGYQPSTRQISFINKNVRVGSPSPQTGGGVLISGDDYSGYDVIRTVKGPFYKGDVIEIFTMHVHFGPDHSTTRAEDPFNIVRL